MKKVFLLVIISVVVLVGCDMNPQSTYYFYSLAELPDGVNTVPIDVTIRGVWWKPTNYTIIMSRGLPLPNCFDQDKVEAEIPMTTFTLKLDGVDLTPTTLKTVDYLVDSYHVVQSFSTGDLEKGDDYLLEGTTVSTGTPSFTRRNVVRLRVR